MKAGKSAIWPWLVCQYNKNTLVDLPSSVVPKQNIFLVSSLPAVPVCRSGAALGWNVGELS